MKRFAPSIAPLFAALLLLAAPAICASAEPLATVKPVTVYAGVEDSLSAGELLIVTGEAKQSPALLVRVNGDYKHVMIKPRRTLFELADVRDLKNGNHLIQGAAGKYAIEVIVFDPGFDSIELVGEIGKRNQPPPPDIGPEDDQNEDDQNEEDQNEPLAGLHWVVVIEESSQRSTTIAKMVGADIDGQIAAMGLRWYLQDKDDSTGATYHKYLQKAGVELPGVVFADETGKPLKTFPLPESTDALIEAIKAAR